MGPRAIRTAVGDQVRSARARIGGSAIVLAYHRVADLGSDPQRLAVGVERFDEQMGLLSASYNPMGAGELVELVAHRRRIPERSVVVTIDDGYADALLDAKPILSAHSVPATVFVSSDYVGADVEFWWDELERIVLCAEELPSRVDIDAGDGRPAAEGWDITKAPASERQRVYLELREYLLPLRSADRETALASLRAQFGAAALVRPSHRTLTAEQLRELGDGGLVEIGAHTRSHQLLAARTHDEQRDEITGSKNALEQVLGREVRLFSYPYGGSEDFSESTARLVREAGFLGAFTTGFGIVLPWTDRFCTPRCPTEDINGAELAKRLDRWFEMAR